MSKILKKLTKIQKKIHHIDKGLDSPTGLHPKVAEKIVKDLLKDAADFLATPDDSTKGKE